MKSLTILTGAAAFALLLAGPGAVRGEHITATVTETEESYVIWEVVVPGIEAVAVLADYAGTAAADALFTQRAIGNSVEESNVSRRVVFEGSGLGHTGLVAINQEDGNFNNQVNLRVVAISEGGALQVSDIDGTMELTGNTVISSGARETRIEDSFQGGAGILGINQSAGNLNQQANVLVMTMTQSLLAAGAVVIGDSTLGAIGGVDDNTLVEDLESPRSDVLVNSLGGFTGYAQVNQSSGDLNRSANLLSVTISVINIP